MRKGRVADMVKKILIMGVMLIMCMGILGGCGNNSYKQVDFGGTILNGSIKHEPMLIQEHSELVSVFGDLDITWEKGIAIWERYDSKFFENKTLLVYFFDVSGDVEPRIAIDDIQVDGGIIKISLLQHGTTAGLAYFSKNIVIEVNKKFIGDSTKVEVDIKVKKWNKEDENHVKENYCIGGGDGYVLRVYGGVRER